MEPKTRKIYSNTVRQVNPKNPPTKCYKNGVYKEIEYYSPR